jgi:hypothetical protein
MIALQFIACLFAAFLIIIWITNADKPENHTSSGFCALLALIIFAIVSYL